MIVRLKHEVLVKQGGNLAIYSSATEILQAVNMMEELLKGREWGQGSSAAVVPSSFLMASERGKRGQHLSFWWIGVELDTKGML